MQWKNLFKPRLPRLRSPSVTIYWAKNTLPDYSNSFLFANGSDLDDPIILKNQKPFKITKNIDYRKIGTVSIKLDGGLILDSYAEAVEIALPEQIIDDLTQNTSEQIIPKKWVGKRIPEIERPDEEIKQFLKNSR